MTYDRYLLPLVIISFCAAAFLSIRPKVKQQTIIDLNNRQLAHEAAAGIQDYFRYMTDLPRALSRKDHIVPGVEDGKQMMSKHSSAINMVKEYDQESFNLR